jgi:hypothetical protein
MGKVIGYLAVLVIGIMGGIYFTHGPEAKGCEWVAVRMLNQAEDAEGKIDTLSNATQQMEREMEHVRSLLLQCEAQAEEYRIMAAKDKDELNACRSGR